jgi:hypothetical protein
MMTLQMPRPLIDFVLNGHHRTRDKERYLIAHPQLFAELQQATLDL